MTIATDTPAPPDLAWLVSLARRLARPGEDADDLAQETWLVAAQQPDRSKGSSRQWLAGVLRNLRRMRARTDRRRREREHDVPPADDVRPDDAMAQLETLEALRVALGELDPIDRRLVLGRYATGTSAVELGEQFDMPASTVRTRLARARERLRNDVESERGAACFLPFVLRPGEVGAAGVVAMSTATKIGIGIAAVAVLGIGAQRLAAGTTDTKTTPTSAAVTSTTPVATRASDRNARAEEIRVKRERIREQRVQRLAMKLPTPDAAEPTAIVTDQCDDGCMGTLNMQLAIASVIAGCRDDLPEGAKGKTKYRARVIAEPGIGAVVDTIEVIDDTFGDGELAECIAQSAPLAELADPEHPISDDFVFRFNVGVPADPAGEFLAAHPDLLAGHPELAAIAARPEGTPPTDEDATTFARWVDTDPTAQAAFGKWAAEQGLDLAHVTVH
ncbi:MAG TPA: sigma-70 family RNA polymerase sigma factor [Nannocystaceae bacterium]|nr:sigma-70 family RNA polymerase sigma factor [Nannocystaceae bacterium]